MINESAQNYLAKSAQLWLTVTTGSVGNKAVQEVIAGKNYYNTDEAIVITTSEFTRSAKELADASNVILIDKNKLKDMVNLAF